MLVELLLDPGDDPVRIALMLDGGTPTETLDHAISREDVWTTVDELEVRSSARPSAPLWPRQIHGERSAARAIGESWSANP